MIMYTVADDPMAESEVAQVIAFICGLFVILLMIMGLVSTDWLMAQGWQQGLFAHCIEEGALTPLPFNIQANPGCYQARDAGYIRAAAVLCVVCLLADIAATVLTGLGLRTQDHCDKNKYYRYAVFCMGGALISLLSALVIYPVFFAAELNLGNRTSWEFGWAYGVGWGAAIFLFGGAVLLLCDKESEEIYYKERKIVRDDVASGAVNASSANAMLNANQRQQQQQNHHYQQAAQQQFYANANSNHHHQLSSLAAQQQQQQQAYAGMRSGAQLHA